MTTRVVILISGGTFQGAWSDDDVDLEVVDMDDLEAEGKTEAQRERILDKATKGLEAF